MGSGGKGAGAAGKVYDYYASFGAVLCAGPLDGLAGIVSDGKLVWPSAKNWEAGSYALNALAAHRGMVWRSTAGSNTTKPGESATWVRYALMRHASLNPQSVSVEDYGIGYIYWGTSNQVLDASGEALLAAGGHPAYRRQALFVGKKFLCGRERTSLPNLQFIGFRYPRQNVIYTASVTSGGLVVGHWYEVRGTGTITHNGGSIATGALFLAGATTWIGATGAPAVHEVGLDADWQANPFAALAEYLTDDTFGLGLPAVRLNAASWSAAAAAARSNAAKLYLSPLVLKAEDGRAFIQRVLDHIDGWLRMNADGEIEAGLWSHGIDAPAWTSANTIDYHDLVEPADLDPTSWQDTTNVTTVNFSDRERSYKTRPVRASNSWNRESTGGRRERSLERPYILRATQANVVAAEDAKLAGQPFHEGTLEVRAEKASSILPGSIFRLTHDAVGLSVPCRCVGKTLAAPPSGRVSLRYQTERGLAALPYVATTANGVPDAPPPPSRIASLEILQIPPALADGEDFSLAILAARADALTSRFDVWLRQVDVTDFYFLLTAYNFATGGAVAATFAPYTDGSGSLVDDDDALAVQVTIASGTPAPELDRMDDVQTADAVEDNALLLFLVRSADPTQIEILTIKEAVLVSGRTYNLVVRRARFGTQQGVDGTYSFGVGDRAWIIYRSLLLPFTSDRLKFLATEAESAFFRIVPGTSYGVADVADVYDAGTNPDGLTTQVEFDFVDPYSPVVTWTAIQQRPNPSTAWADISSFAVDFDPTTEFRVVAALSDPTGDLQSADFRASAGNLVRTLFAGAVSGSYSELDNVFTLPTGDWQLVMQVADASGRTSQALLSPVGGGAEVVIRVRATASPVVANPLVSSSPASSTAVGKRSVATISCSTSGATIKYQWVAIGAVPGGSWLTYAGSVFLFSHPVRLHTYALKAGMTDSALVTVDFPYY